MTGRCEAAGGVKGAEPVMHTAITAGCRTLQMQISQGHGAKAVPQARAICCRLAWQRLAQSTQYLYAVAADCPTCL